MIDLQNILVLHAALHPIDRNAQFASSAREAAGHFARGRMLAQSVSTARTLFPHYPIIIVVGVWGLAPCSPEPLTFSHPTDRNAELTSPARGAKPD